MNRRRRRISDLDTSEDLIAALEEMERSVRILTDRLMDIELRIGKILATIEGLPREGETR